MHIRRKLIVGNWKMNGSLASLGELAEIAAAAREAAGVDVAICPPFTLISPAVARSAGLPIGAQDCHSAESGAHTGNVSAAMIKEAGAKLVIVGHSERRAGQAESDECVAAKAARALAFGLQAIVCVGESDEVRSAGGALDFVTRQLSNSLPEPRGDAELVVAYEPIWAIGTGRNATADDVREMHRAIRSTLAQRLGESGDRVRILYGGSVKGDNAAELLAVEDVDGVLVGGASLTAAAFVPIIAAAGRS